jgi:serine/threonine protein kinase
LPSTNRQSSSGAGLFGRVRLVTVKDGAEDEVFALKCMSIRQIDEYGQKAAVIAEKTCMQTFDHPFINTLFATFRDDSLLYLLLELCQGGELFNLLQIVYPLPEKWVKFYAAQVRGPLSFPALCFLSLVRPLFNCRTVLSSSSPSSPPSSSSSPPSSSHRSWRASTCTPST